MHLNLSQLSHAVDIPILNQAVAAAYRQYAVGQTLIFTATVQHAHHIAELIDGAVVVSADTPDRAEIIERFTKREIPCLVNCMIFTEGTDMPLIETVIIARPSRNASLYTQMVGRGLRLHSDKEDLNLIDCVGITGKLNICTAPDLFGIGKLPKGITQADIQGKRLTEIEEMIEEEANRQPDWKINVQRIQLFETEGKYDTHKVNYIIMPDGSMICSIGEKRVIKVRAEDITGNSYAYMVHDNHIVWTIQPAPMQEVLDGVYDRLVCDYQRAKNLWDLELVKRWGTLPATLSQLSYSDDYADYTISEMVDEIDNINDFAESYSELYDLWSKGSGEILIDMDMDLEDLPDDLLDDHEAYVKVVLDDRNQYMADKASEFIKEGKNCLFMVGAAHYSGNNGVDNLLEKMGYTVEKVA